jgi:hypothetical protein
MPTLRQKLKQARNRLKRWQLDIQFNVKLKAKENKMKDKKKMPKKDMKKSPMKKKDCP